MDSLFIQLPDIPYTYILKKLTLMTGFVVQSHIWYIIHLRASEV